MSLAAVRHKREEVNNPTKSRRDDEEQTYFVPEESLVLWCRNFAFVDHLKHDALPSLMEELGQVGQSCE